jgi:hypothetical protein
MSSIKLTPAEQALFEEVGSRGDYFREATRDRAADEVNRTGRMSEITTEGGQMLDAVMPAAHEPEANTVSSVVSPTDLEPVPGPAPTTSLSPVKR